MNRALRNGKVFFSDATFNEFAEVLYRQKLDKYFFEGEREEILAALTLNCIRYNPDIQIKASRDPKDDKFLELAVSAKATCLISGDFHLLELHPFQGIPILNAANYLKSF